MTFDKAEYSVVRRPGAVRKGAKRNDSRRLGTLLYAMSRPTVTAAS